MLSPLGCGEFSPAIGLLDGPRVVISRLALPPAEDSILLRLMLYRRSTMRERYAKARLHLHALTVSGRAAVRIQKFALYGAFALIAAVVFGSLSVHPF
jgi:hypothetical protein